MAASRTLPVTPQALGEGACCGACAVEAGRGHRTAQAAGPATRPTISRDADRRITFGGVALAGMLLAAAVVSVALPVADRRGLWLPLHLALAGAAGTAIAAVLPFFMAALSVARPVRAPARAAAIALVAVGAVAVAVAVPLGWIALAVAGGLVYLTGLGFVAVAAFLPLRGTLGPRRRLVESAYAVAILQVMVGVALATAMLAGFEPVIERWAALKPAHAWLNVLGFLSLIVAASLLHLGPTVAGSRMVPRRSGALAVLGLAAGPPLVALAFALGADRLATAGAAVEITGAMALLVHGLSIRRDRGRWTTDAAWHRFTSWSLGLAPIWLLVAVVAAAGRILVLGATPAAWNVELVVGPLVVGWLVQVLIGAWSHLVPAIGPGDQVVHARQRVVLGRWVPARLVLLNGGVAALAAGLAFNSEPLAVTGGLAAVTAVALAVMLLGEATVGTGAISRTGRPRPAV